jgi:histidinol-phosphate aminotransferase
VGYAVGSEELIEGLNRVKNSFNSYPVDSIAQKIATTAKPNTKQVIKTREYIKTKLDCLDSQTNFIWWNVENAKSMYDYLYQNKILVRFWEQYPNNLRVTIGTDRDMRRFLECVEKRMKLK